MDHTEVVTGIADIKSSSGDYYQWFIALVGGICLEVFVLIPVLQTDKHDNLCLCWNSGGNDHMACMKLTSKHP